MKRYNNNCFIVGTNYDSIDSIGFVQKWDKSKKKVKAPQLCAVNNYSNIWKELTIMTSL